MNPQSATSDVQLPAAGPRIVIFDFDGVIVESNAIKDEAFWHVFSQFGPDAADLCLRYHLANHGQSRYEKVSASYGLVFGQDISPQMLTQLGQEFSDYCLDRIINCAMVPGALEFLRDYHERVPLAVASATPESELQQIIQTRKLDGYFAAVHGKPTSKEANLRKILHRYAISPVDAVFVGDQISDLAAAREVGVPFVGRVSDEGEHPLGVESVKKVHDLNQLAATLGLE